MDQTESAILTSFNAWADWQESAPCAEVVRTNPPTVRVPIGGGWAHFMAQDDGAWAEIETPEKLPRVRLCESAYCGKCEAGDCPNCDSESCAHDWRTITAQDFLDAFTLHDSLAAALDSLIPCPDGYSQLAGNWQVNDYDTFYAIEPSADYRTGSSVTYSLHFENWPEALQDALTALLTGKKA